MILYTKVFFTVLVIVFLSGCYSVAKPYAINGKYYMAGDSNCEKYQSKWSLTGSYINCFTSDGKFTEKRKTMNDKELQDYVDKASKPTYYPIFIPIYY